ncbi:iron-containing alcohol dehydrogenase [Ruania alba]|uniref:Alcohol dehydrogenase n=1 Tax=Ruania alba TaxID=648782 RepID=A0A1H5BEA4_9MICO|nr:iron-containing alcohol dehydrogenase [Ruania alba]SED52902.1 alcohol dehydrogenase [Ruania alba]
MSASTTNPQSPTEDSAAFGVLRGPRRLIFGQGQRHAVAHEVAALGTRVLVCTDSRVAGSTAFAEMINGLRQAGCTVTVYDRVEAELPVTSVHECVTSAGDLAPDVVLGVGGGTCIDLAKAAALLLTHHGRLQDYYGENAVPGPVLPVVAVPTTGGTGSEVTPVCVLTDPAAEFKVGISSLHLIPDVAICDPDLTLSCPPALTASAGADALSHLVEAFTAVRRGPEVTTEQRVFVGKNMLSDHYARWGLGLIGRSLARAVDHPADRQARADVMLAANAGGYALGVAGTAAAHAVQYPVGALTKTPHGVGVGTLLPYVMRLNQSARSAEFAEIGAQLGAETTSDGGIDAVTDLLAAIRIPATLAELGVTDADAGYIAERTMRSRRLVDNNPVPLDEVTVRRLVDAAIAGDHSALSD